MENLIFYINLFLNSFHFNPLVAIFLIISLDNVNPLDALNNYIPINPNILDRLMHFKKII